MTGRRIGWRALAVCFVAAAVVLSGWWVYNRYFYERANPSIEAYPLRGIDISAHNGDIDFITLAKDKRPDFVYMKATEGTDFIDRNFARNATGLFRVGIPAGAYHFFRFDTDGEMQAWNFIHALRGRHFALPPAIDLEEWSNPTGFTTRHILKELRRMLAVLRMEGYEPLIYTNKDGYERFVKGNLDEYPLWICSFTDPPIDGGNNAWEVWQYSHRGSVPGISGSVDCNTVNPGAKFEQIVCGLHKSVAK